MSIRVVGYLGGRRVVVDEGESHARVIGWGGTSTSNAIPLMAPVPWSGHRTALATSRALDRPRCAAALLNGGLCARNPGHGTRHRSASSLAADSRRRPG